MPVKAKDFIEVEYTGRLKEDNTVFDTTDANVAKENGLPEGKYGPVVVCVGEGQLIKGLDEQLQGKEPGKYTIELPPEKAFGKKDAKLVQMVPASKFKDQKIQPVTGLRISVNGLTGVVRNVTGGRILLDFNHPLAGRDVVYEITIKRTVTDKKEQLEALFKMLLGITDAKISVSGEKAIVELQQQLPEQIAPELQKKIKELVKVDAEFKTAKQEKTEKKE